MRTTAKSVRPNKLTTLAIASVLLVGCPDPVPLPPTSCLPGAQTECACPGGTRSVQVCGTDRVLGLCQCGGDAGMDVATVDGGDAGTGASDTSAVDLGAGDLGSADVGDPDTGSPAPDIGSPTLDTGSGADVLPAGCVATTPGNCCGVACPAADHASPVCGGGTCTVACMVGYASCDGTLTNGCEVTLATSDVHCGGCGTACAMGQRCTMGMCQCPAGQTLCGGRCVNTQTDAANCGACGAPCAAGGACVGGACVLCTGGQTPCPGACVDTQTNNAHCGGCGRACPSGQGCVAGTCQVLCALGEFAMCSPSGSAPNCCADGRTCGVSGVTQQCCRPPGGACTGRAGCCSLGTVIYCMRGVCCISSAASGCTENSHCCSNSCGRVRPGVCD